MNLLHSPTTATATAADSTCSTPYASAPSSPGHTGPHSTGFFYSAPTSPMHFAITTLHSHSSPIPISHDFEFSSRFASTGFKSSGSMSSADELFFNGQIRPNNISTHLEPLLDLEQEDEEENDNDVVFDDSHVVVRGRDLMSFRDKSLRRKARSLSPSRNTDLEWIENNDNVTLTNENENGSLEIEEEDDEDGKRGSLEISTHTVSASSSRSSSAGRSSKRWVFLKDFLRSKSEGRSNNKFWSTISFSPTKDKKVINQNQDETPKPKVNSQTFSKRVVGKPANGVGKRRVTSPSPHELHYKANRAQAEELRKKTFLPYKQGLFGCLGFSSKGYGAMSGFARALNPVSSR
ncbi:hypothetical protein TanjilG_22589 [Lupinus angustifolius]|uniref:Uncharacterized protein n=1 Tax=Lupinus angustifolius TaxID=3871 RepID=A0A4P1RT33_LUPAN|nr:PREDICTED: uncharacterized protein LOC109332236 [Lupinus angustifolius]OIW17477.1 hypothetical protein TanjilG_22589 [Lupinus angustifolius]